MRKTATNIASASNTEQAKEQAREILKNLDIKKNLKSPSSGINSAARQNNQENVAPKPFLNALSPVSSRDAHNQEKLILTSGRHQRAESNASGLNQVNPKSVDSRRKSMATPSMKQQAVSH